MTRLFRRGGALFALLLALLASAGCDNTVDPFTESDRYFTVFGYLDTGADTQYVRVIPLRQDLDPEAERTIDARVTLTDVQTGHTFTLRDSLITFSGGRYGHVYHLPLHPVPGHTYRLSVERADGLAATAETTVPVLPNVTISAAEGTGVGGRYEQVVRWQGIDAQPFAIEVWYRFGMALHAPFRDVVLRQGPGRLTPDGLEVRVALTEDYSRLRDQVLGPAFLTSQPLMGIGMRLSMPDDAWRPPGGVFDPEVLAQPGTFNNVTNGFGFFGSANRYTAEWVLSPQTTRALGYTYPN